MKHKLSSSLGSAGTLLAVALLLFPVTGHCEWFSSVKEMVGLKGKNMKEAATKVATLSEDEDIRGLDFSPDGKYLATTSPNTRKVHIWDWRNKAHIVQTLEKDGTDLTTTEPIRYSPDGHLLVWCGGTVARIWNTATWQLIHSIDGTNGLSASGGGCMAARFTPDGKSLILVLERVARHLEDNLMIFDTSSWQPTWGNCTTPFYTNTLSVSPDGKYIALGGEVRNPRNWPFTQPIPTFGDPPFSNTPLIALVDLAQRKIVRTIKTNGIDRLAWSPDGTHIASGGPLGIEIFNATTGAREVDESAYGAHVLIRYSPNGKYLIESGLGEGRTTVEIWDGQHRELLQEIKAMPGSMAVSRDGRYLAMGGDKKILIWELK